MAAREAAETMGRGLRQSVSASSGHVQVKTAKVLIARLMADDVVPADVVDVVHALSKLIEDEELRYESLVGDNGGSHRAGYAIGRILSLVQDDPVGDDEGSVVSKFCLDALTQPSSSPKVQAAGVRLLRSVVSVTGFQFPLTDERLIDRLSAWALGPMQVHAESAPRTARREAFDAAEAAETAAVEAESQNAPTASLARKAAHAAHLDALRVKTHAMGCLAVALEAEDVASALVRDGIMTEIMKPLKSVLVDKEQAEGVSSVEAIIRQTAGDTDENDDKELTIHDLENSEDIDAAGKALAEALVKRGAADVTTLPALLVEARLRALASVGEYIECFGQALQCGAVDVGLALVKGTYWGLEHGWPEETARRRVRFVDDSQKISSAPQLPEALAAVCSLLAHRKFAMLFVDRGGVQALLNVPKGLLSSDESYRCLFAVSQINSAMEHLLAPSSRDENPEKSIARRCVDFVLTALDGGHDGARRHAALFLALAFPFPAILDAFDAAGGLRPLLNLLRHAAQLSATANMSPAAKQTACHACHALRQYCRAHLHRRISAAGGGGTAPWPYRPVDLSHAATDRNLRQASHDRNTASLMQRQNWLPWWPIDAFIAQGGHEIVLALMSVAAGDRHFHECVPAGLATLRIATLHPAAREATTTVSVVTYGNTSLTAADVLLEISARAAGAQDAETAIDALHVLCQLVAPPPALVTKESVDSVAALKKGRTPKKLLSRRGSLVTTRVDASGSVDGNGAVFDQTLQPGRASVREAGGLRALLQMLTRGSKRLPPPNDDAARALCCNALLAMARDPQVAQTLQTLQVARRLTEMVSTHKHKRRESGKSTAEAGTRSGTTAETTATSTSIEAGAEFYNAAVELIAVTAGGAARGSHALAAANAVTHPLRRMERHAIAAATKVQYPHEDLLRLIHEHLSNAGLGRTADTLAIEVAESGILGAGNAFAVVPVPQPRGHKKFAPSPKTPRTVSKTTVKRRGSFAGRVPGVSVTGVFGGTDTPRPGAFTLGLQTPCQKTQFHATATKTGRQTRGNKPVGPNTSGQTPRRSKRKANAIDSPSELPGPAHGLFAGADAVSPGSVFSGRTHARFSPLGTKTLTAAKKDLPCVFIDDDWEGCGVRSKLDGVMTTFLRAQHRQCQTPNSACAPFSLLEPHACVEPRHLLDAPVNVTNRVHRREWFQGGGLSHRGPSGVPRGGPYGKQRDRHFVFGRFRPTRSLRDEGAKFTCSSFIGSEGDKLLAGTNDGTLRLFDVNTGEVLEYVDAGHEKSVRNIQTCEIGAQRKQLALSSSATETMLWDLSITPEFGSDGPLVTFGGACSASFDASNGNVFHAGGNTPGTAMLYDVSAKKTIRTFFTWNEKDTDGNVMNASSASRRFTTRATSNRRFADTAVGSVGSSLVLWGNTLWDIRLPHPIRTFDSFSDGGGCSFHPRGDSIVLNSEVWDLRSDKLLRSISSLDGCSLNWTNNWDVGLVFVRLPKDESIVTSSRKTKHPLRNSFRTVDGAANDFSEIATIDVDRNVLHLNWDAGTDIKCCVTEVDPNDGTADSVVRIYEAGRRRPQEEDSDAEEDDNDEGDDGMGDDENNNNLLDLNFDDDAIGAMDEMNVLDEDDEQRAARTAAAIAGDGAALAGLRALLGGIVADRIRGAVIGEGAGLEDDEDDEDIDSDVDFSLEDDDGGDGEDSVDDDDSDSESESVLLSLSSSGDENGDSVEDSGGESSDDEESEGGF